MQILTRYPNCYIKYKFFNDCDYVKSDILCFSSYDMETSVIDVEMKSSHSLMLSKLDKIKEHLLDFPVEIAYKNEYNEEIIIGHAIISVEDLIELTTSEGKIGNTLFIYGTAKVIIFNIRLTERIV
jgi:hypothetical protein